MGNCCATSSEQIQTDITTELGDDHFRGKVAFVTGPTTGIGKHTSLILAKLQMHVILAGRGANKLQALEGYIRSEVPNAQLTSLELDLSDLNSVRACADRFNALNLPLNYLINNAGVMGGPYRKSAQGFEMQFATNHLGHFLLTELLLPKLKQSAPSRIVCVASLAHSFAKLDVENPVVDDTKYDQWVAYGNSKMANVLHARALNRRLDGTGVTAYSLHPGSIASDLGRNSCAANCYYTLFKCCQKNLSQGAATSLFVALSPDAIKHSGRYFKDCHVADVTAPGGDDQVAERLYQVSLQLVQLQNSNASQ